MPAELSFNLCFIRGNEFQHNNRNILKRISFAKYLISILIIQSSILDHIDHFKYNGLTSTFDICVLSNLTKQNTPLMNRMIKFKILKFVIFILFSIICRQYFTILFSFCLYLITLIKLIRLVFWIEKNYVLYFDIFIKKVIKDFVLLFHKRSESFRSL